MAKPLVGTTYPTVTGETKTQALIRIAGELPDMQVWSHYWEPGKGYPTFTEDFWAELPDTVQLVLLSVKDSNVTTLTSRFPNIPERWRGKVAITINHEPDQWRSATDTHGDLSPTVWWQKMQELLNARDAAVGTWGPWVQVYPCFTEDRLRRDGVFWEMNWGSRIKTESRFDFIAFDTFNIGRSTVRPGMDIIGGCVAWVRSLPYTAKLVLREYGQVTPVDQPVDSTQVVAGITENWEYAKTQNAIDDIILAIVWYYNHNNILADPARVRRPNTLALLKQIVTEAAVDVDDPEEMPDPEHQQYRWGYEVGLVTGRGEVTDVVRRALASYEDPTNS